MARPSNLVTVELQTAASTVSEGEWVAIGGLPFNAEAKLESGNSATVEFYGSIDKASETYIQTIELSGSGDSANFNEAGPYFWLKSKIVAIDGVATSNAKTAEWR